MKKTRTLKDSFKMSSCKSLKPKTELVAIYRLEFYKKQKNWKLASSPHGKKSSKKPVDRKNDLNTTYNIEECSDNNDQSDPLNVAFVDLDDNKQTQDVKSEFSISKTHELSQQWLEPVNIWPDLIKDNIIQGNKNVSCVARNNVALKNVKASKSEGYIEKPERHCTTHRLQQLQKAAQLQEHQDNIQNILKESLIDHGVNRSNENDNFVSEHYEVDKQYLCTQDNWPILTGELPGGEHMAQDIWPEEKDMYGHSEDIMYSASWFPDNISHFDSTPLVGPGVMDSEDWRDLSVDSFGEFMRGADAAPHSSEVDLALPSEVSAADVSFAALSRLSSRQLALAARLHARLLRRLLLEAEQRQRLHLPSEYSSVEEFPTRDAGPGPRQTLHRSIYTDAFVAGSHLEPQGLIGTSLRSGGRGRGRLT